ncbi:MAG: rhodanese-like domain-containing protein [Salinivirgaceae bacterium]|jgi:rhodanese-related sulfurtransferase|nr:rhodanese-like domain-containing protein [Salinivirgaceae bacterium]
MKSIKNIKPKILQLKARVLLAYAIIPMAVLISFVPENTTKPYKLTIEEVIGEITEGAQYFSTDQIAEYIVQKDPSIQLIDVRNSDEYESYHLPGAINIPLADILSEDLEGYLDQDVVTNVFYSNGTVNANQAWLICTQRGFKNNYVLQGGMNYWAETIMNPKKPSQNAPSDEFARYDFRKAMKAALGGGTIEANTEPVESATAMPIIKKKKRRKRAAGGC